METSYTQDTPSTSYEYGASTVSAVSRRTDTAVLGIGKQSTFPPRLSDVVRALTAANVSFALDPPARS